MSLWCLVGAWSTEDAGFFFFNFLLVERIRCKAPGGVDRCFLFVYRLILLLFHLATCSYLLSEVDR